ncbi:patatin-like phospholipase family protein [Photobacterium leiognathi]|uniref:patatin-like phospholipase family protein n=1 Tax=Photobacterium leiognathi TaxID=553611 RepID=UPI003DA19FA5
MIVSPLLYWAGSKKFRKISGEFKTSISKNGVYSTCNLESILWELFTAKFPNFQFKGKKCITFKELFSLTKIELKVIVSDVHSGQAIIFGYDNEETADSCVISAVCASSSYPLVFEPNTTLKNNCILVDGGLSCNLPTFIFNDKNHKKLPLYAFDLYKDSEDEIPPVKTKNILEFGWRLISTSLEASNAILSSLIDAIPVKVRVPNSIETLDFDLKKASIIEMYETGKQSARKSFKNDPLTSKAVLANDNPTKLARALYGSELYLNILSSIIHVSNIYGMGIEIRSWLYTSVTHDDSEVVAICWKGTSKAKSFRDKYVFDSIKLSDTYECWRTKRPVITGKVDSTRLCLPIFNNHIVVEKKQEEASSKTPQKIIGVLVLEMNQPKELCFWLNEKGDAVSEQYSKVIRNWLSIISKLMVSKEALNDY